jgi:uncharacterized protein YbaR (Trm112 family)
MKLSRIYKNQIWTCPSCKSKLSPGRIILSPFSLNIINMERKIGANFIFINKKGMIDVAQMPYITKSNFNKMLVCPKCKKEMLIGFLMQLSPNTKNKEKTVNPYLNEKNKVKSYIRYMDMAMPVVSQPSITVIGIGGGGGGANEHFINHSNIINWGSVEERVIRHVSNPEQLPEGSL